MEGIKREVYLARFYTRPTFMFFSLAFSGMCQSIFGHSRSHLLSKSIRAWPSVCVFSMSHGYLIPTIKRDNNLKGTNPQGWKTGLKCLIGGTPRKWDILKVVAAEVVFSSAFHLLLLLGLTNDIHDHVLRYCQHHLFKGVVTLIVSS